MKIEIRKRPPEAKMARIAVREKTLYVCKRCGNHYYAYYFFCPQCMGEVANTAPQFSMLRIVSCFAEASEEAGAILQKLAGSTGFDFNAAMKKPPWLCMKQSDPAILRIWKDCMGAAGIQAEINASLPPARGRKRKEHPPLFAQNAPYPEFLPAAITQEMRGLAQALPSASLKLAWAETSALAMNLLERIYKKQSERVLFIDYVYQTEEMLREFTTKFSSGKVSNPAFERQNQILHDAFQRMGSEMDSVREQVQKQL